MKKIYSVFFLSVFILLSAVSANAQSYWQKSAAVAGKIPTAKAVARLSFPKEFKLFNLDLASIKQELFKVTDNAQRHTTVISLPNTDGGIEQFQVVEASNFEPALQARFPQIRAFSGQGITDPSATLKLSISPQGIATMVFRADKPAEFIEPYSADHTVYSVFHSYRPAGALPWLCSTADEHLAEGLAGEVNTHRPESNDGILRVMRLAQSCNGEYANYFGASTAGTAADQAIVLAAYNATLTRCNGCYEKDLAVHLNLIPTTTDVIFYDPSTDPYSTNLNQWNGQLLTTLKNIIGDANFDIGHMFGASGGGGNAGCIGCVCGNGTTTATYKGSGITSPADGIPEGDNFDIDYVVHEVGHQMGGNHTFTFQSEGGTLATSAQREVGSGISIMGYAGITGATDDSVHSIPYYHEYTIFQIQTNLATKTCPVTTVITPNNATPVLAPVANYTIPISTPFALTASATDANAADVLTYQWEENDPSTSQTGTNSGARANKPSGPNWLSFNPTISPTRYFPRLSTVLTGASLTPSLGGAGSISVEALSSVARTLAFRCTVRDNHAYSSTAPVAVGQTAFTDMVVTVDASGPFLITSQNTAVTYAGNSTQTVTWSVNGTNIAPVGATNVKISWSSDAGGTFPIVLLASTANDGTENVTIPAGATTTGRIKVEAIGNIFFDINNANITVTASPTTDFAFGASATSTSACPAGTPTVTIPVTVTGTPGPVTFAATAGVPAGATVTFVPNPLTGAGNTVATLNNASTVPAGTYNITVTGTAGTITHTTTITFVITAGTPPNAGTVANQTVCAPAAATFTVSSTTPGATYQWQVSTAGAGGPYTNVTTGTGGTTNTYSTGATTAAMNGYAYHVIVSTFCGGSVTSNNATLTVNTAAAITSGPTPATQSVCTGNTATFTVAATGTGATYQWQSSPTGAAGTFVNVSTGTGANTNTYTTGAITAASDAFYRVIVTTTTCAGTVTSSTATITISTTTAIAAAGQPNSQTVCAPAAATFTVTATGTGNTYQWQVSTTGVGGPYTNVTTGTGGTTNSYNTGATTAGVSGYAYHVVVTGQCNTVTSNNVTLTVNTAAAIAAAGQPAAQTVCSGTTATFTVTATGTGAAYQWQVSTTGAGGPYTNVTTGTGGTTNSYTTAAATPAMNGYYYHVIVTTTACAGTVTSNNVLLTVNTTATISAGGQPTDQSACVPNTATFSVTATGTGLSYQWQVSTDGGTTFNNVTTGTGGTTNTYTTAPATVAMNGYKYRVLIYSTCSPATPITSNVVTLSVNNPVSVTQNPAAQSGCAGDTYTFSVTANPATGVNYQWQVSTNGGATYTNITGAASATYVITNAPIGLSGNLYRVIVSGGTCGQVITPGVSLTLGNRPTVVLAAATASTLNPSIVSGINATVSPAGNYVYSWRRNGVIIPNTLATTYLPLSPDNFGTYQLTVFDVATGCAGVSNALRIDSLVSGHLFIYPNPVTTTMQVRYYSADPAAHNTMLTVYDSKGARVASKEYTVTGTYGRMDVDMSRMTDGVYMVELRDGSGRKLAAAPVVKGH